MASLACLRLFEDDAICTSAHLPFSVSSPSSSSSSATFPSSSAAAAASFCLIAAALIALEPRAILPPLLPLALLRLPALPPPPLLVLAAILRALARWLFLGFLRAAVNCERERQKGSGLKKKGGGGERQKRFSREHGAIVVVVAVYPVYGLVYPTVYPCIRGPVCSGACVFVYPCIHVSTYPCIRVSVCSKKKTKYNTSTAAAAAAAIMHNWVLYNNLQQGKIQDAC